MIRIGGIDDISKVNIIRKQVNDMHIKGEPDIFKNNFEVIENFIYDFTKNTDDKFLIVYEENKNILGYAMVEFLTKPETIYRKELKYLYIDEFGVLDSHRGKNIGTKLLEYLTNFAKSRGYHSMELNAWSFNESAIKFYTKNDFEIYRVYLRKYF